ncbi:MAG: hypothetical protein Q8L48_32780 [Archangium sp.]|nr:hypothetical protein [Archangium sp.]
MAARDLSSPDPRRSDGPRKVPLSTRLALLTKGNALVSAALVFSIGAPMCGLELGNDAGRTLFSPTVDVPGRVVSYERVRKSAPKGPIWTEYRVQARFTWVGEEHVATGDIMDAVGFGSPVTVRVPTWRPSLAHAFTGSEPRHPWRWLLFFVIAVVGGGVVFGELRRNVRDLRQLDSLPTRGSSAWGDCSLRLHSSSDKPRQIHSAVVGHRSRTGRSRENEATSTWWYR